MKKLIAVVGIIMISISLMVGCKATPKEPEGTLLIKDTTNTAKVGERLKVKLAENVSTGFSWAYTISDDKGIVLVEEFVKQDNEGKPGAGSEKTWIFEPKTTGTFTIAYVYSQSFDEETPPSEEALYTIEVK